MSETAKSNFPLFSWRAVIIMVVISVLSFSSLIVMSAFAPDLEDKDAAGLHAYSHSALGYNFAFQLLKASGYEVEISREKRFLTDTDEWGILIVTPSSNYDLKALKDIDFDRIDPSLIILPKRWGFAGFTNSRHQAVVGELSLEKVAELLTPFGEDFTLDRAPATKKARLFGDLTDVRFTENMQVITGGPIIPILTTKAGTLFGQIEGTNVFVLSEPELFNTHGLKHVENARVMTYLINVLLDEVDDNGYDSTDMPLIFDTTLHGFERSKNFLKHLFTPPMLGATLFAFAAALLLGWAAFIRFGKPPIGKPELATGRRALIESTAGLFSQTRREAQLAPEYGAIAERLALSELGYPEEELTPQQVSHLLEQAEARQIEKNQPLSRRPETANVHTAGSLLHFAKAYHQWKKDLSNGRQ